MRMQFTIGLGAFFALELAMPWIFWQVLFPNAGNFLLFYYTFLIFRYVVFWWFSKRLPQK